MGFPQVSARGIAAPKNHMPANDKTMPYVRRVSVTIWRKRKPGHKDRVFKKSKLELTLVKR